MTTIPIIDISPLLALHNNSNTVNNNNNNDPNNAPIKQTIQQLATACQTHGFFAIIHHGVNTDILSRAWDESQRFFDLHPSIKTNVGMTEEYPYGYENYESLGVERRILVHDTNTSESTGGDGNDSVRNTVEERMSLGPDSKETFSIGPMNSVQSGMPSRRFPQGAPPSFEEALTHYYAAMEQLARTLFRGLALALDLHNDYFLQEGIFDEGHQCALRILNYPELVEQEDVNRHGARIRAGAHTDYGAMTILKSGGPGLQLCLTPEEEEEDGATWIDVPHMSEAFVINLGDLMQRWTNDRWRSTLHRVVAVFDKDWDERNQEEEGEASHVYRSQRRQSIAFFVNMNGDATVVPFETCVDKDHPRRYGPIKASEHLMQRHLRSMGKS